jgi:hypothetical protein
VRISYVVSEFATESLFLLFAGKCLFTLMKLCDWIGVNRDHCLILLSQRLFSLKRLVSLRCGVLLLWIKAI